MKRIVAGVFACAFGDVGDIGAGAKQAAAEARRHSRYVQPLCRHHRAGSETAAKMAVEDFGGEVLGRKVEIVAADHLNKADLAANIARDMLDNQGVEMIFDVAASATALAAGEIAKARGKIVMFNGPGSIRLTNEACGPYTIHYVFDTFAQANVTGLAAVKPGPRHLVLPDRGLRLRPGSGKGHHQCGAEVRRQGAGQRAASDQYVGFLLVPAAGAGLEGQGDRALPTPAATPSTRSSRPPNSD